jgi:hypothetical protein
LFAEISSHMTPALKIPRTLAVVALYWGNAESEVRQRIGSYHAGVGEEFITEEFQGKFAELLEVASGRGEIEQAFVRDVQARYPSVARTELARRARGLIAKVSLHSRDVEARTGGDLGFLVSRPIVTTIRRGAISIHRHYRRGLLCQAKLKRLKGKWGRLTPNQRKVLPQRAAYMSLLLYRYLDEKRLDGFRWQLCKGASLKTMLAWLRDDRFPNAVESAVILNGVGNGSIGTDDEKILSEVVCPDGARVLEIKIDWPDDPPPMEVPVFEMTPLQQVMMIRA